MGSLLVERCQHVFEAGVRLLGDADAAEGRAKLLNVTVRKVDARVMGISSEFYRVQVLTDLNRKSTIKVGCDCERFVEECKGCRHIWSTLVKLDEQSWGPQFERYRTLSVIARRVFNRNDIRDVQSATADMLGGLFQKTVPSGSPAHRSTDGNHWRQQLAAIADVASSPTDGWSRLTPYRDREIWYVLDPKASRQRSCLVIDLYQRERKRNGEFGRLKALTVKRSELEASSDDADTVLLQTLLGQQNPTQNIGAQSYYYQTNTVNQYSTAAVLPALYDLVLAKLNASGRFVIRETADDEIDLTKVLIWAESEIWRLQVRINSDEELQSWTITGRLVCGGATCAVSDALAILRNGLIIFPDRVARFFDEGDFAWVAALRRDKRVQVPYVDRSEFMDWLCKLPLTNVAWPSNLNLERLVVRPQGVLQVLAPESAVNERFLKANVWYVYSDSRIASRDMRAFYHHGCASALVQRDSNAEAQLFQELLDSGARVRAEAVSDGQDGDVEIAQSKFSELVSQLTTAGWRVEAEGHVLRQAGSVQLRVKSFVDWFELTGDVDFNGAMASLPALLAQLRRGGQFVKLSDGSRGLLPREWLAEYRTLTDVGQLENETIRFTLPQGLLLDALLTNHQTVKVDKKFSRWCERLQVSNLVALDAPKRFQGILRPYQKDGLGWLSYLHQCALCGCLADDMGLGKTVQVLAFLVSIHGESRRRGRAPSIVVVPRSLVFNWLAEAARFAPHLRVLNYSGAGRKQLHQQFHQCDVIITTYAMVRIDIVFLKDIAFEYAILDEAQAIKNADAQIAKSVRLLNARRRLAMTGTPIENSLDDLWSIFEFLNPGLLRRAVVAGIGRNREERDTMLEALARGLRPLILRRTKEQVLNDLPIKSEQTLICELTSKEQKLYDELRAHYQAHLLQRVSEQGLNRSKFHVLEALLRLRQAACHPGLLNPENRMDSSSKIDLLLDQLEEILKEGHKALVFSQFTSLLSIVRERLDENGVVYEYLDGSTRNRSARVERFQSEPACGVFLISLKAGGLGLNLTAADYVFILDPWWNPAVEAQAVDRAHRIGQTRRVFAYRFVAKGTVEEKILELQNTKRSLADAIISADNSIIRQLTNDDLNLLLGS